MDTHCINGRAFVGNSPTIVGRSGQRIRWSVFNLDTRETWHNFLPHAMRWRFGGENIDIRSMGPAESFIGEAEIPPVLLLTKEEEAAQDPAHRPEGARLYHLKGEFVFHCHVHHHMMNGMVGLVRARQSVWLTEEMAHAIGRRTGLHNMSQRGIECVISGIGAGSITVDTPPQANLAPPGWYLLFILNSGRVPSVGRWIRLTTP